MSQQDKTNEYNQEPVVYCTKCYSLKIKHEDSINMDYCGDCGCAEVEEAPFEEWEKLYEKKYGHKYAVKSNDPKKNPVFRLSRGELMDRLCSLKQWKSIIHSLYPRFPGGYSKIDSIILFFDKLARDNRIDDLKVKLIDYIKG